MVDKYSVGDTYEDIFKVTVREMDNDKSVCDITNEYKRNNGSRSGGMVTASLSVTD